MIYGHAPEVYGLKLVTAPPVEPITLTEAKLHLKVDLTDDDDLITSLIQSARENVELVTGRALVTQTWEMTMDQFPYPRSYMTGTRPVGGIQPQQIIRLPKPPLQSVTSITYIDSSGNTQTLATNQYVVDVTSLPGSILPAYGVAWPYAQRIPKSVTVRFVAGFADSSGSWAALHAYALNATIVDSNLHLQKATTAGTSAASQPTWNSSGSTTTDGTVTWTDLGVAGVPAGIKAAMKLLLGGWYEHRESIVDARFAQAVPFTVDALLTPFRVMEAA